MLWNASLTATVVTLLAGLFVAAMPPVYQATATVKGEPDGILVIRSGDLLVEVLSKVTLKPGQLRGWLQTWTSEKEDNLTLLKQSLTVESGEHEGWIDITIEASVAKTAAELANEISKIYLGRIENLKFTPEVRATLFKPVEALDEAIRAFTLANPNIANFKRELQALDQKLILNSRTIDNLAVQLEALEKEKLNARTDPTQIRDGAVIRALQRRDAQTVRNAELKTRYGERHQKMIEGEAGLGEAEKLLAEAIRDHLTRLDKKRQPLLDQRLAFENVAREIAKERHSLLSLEAEYQQLKLERESALARFSGLTTEQKRYDFSEAVPPPNSLGMSRLFLLAAIFVATFVLVFLLSFFFKGRQ